MLASQPMGDISMPQWFSANMPDCSVRYHDEIPHSGSCVYHDSYCYTLREL